MAKAKTKAVPGAAQTYAGIQQSIDTDKIDADPRFNSRKHVTVGEEGHSQEELQASIAAQGLLQPIMVRPVGTRYAVVSGFRRYAACKALGLPQIPCVTRNMSEKEARIANGVENMLREDLYPGEQADLCHDLRKGFGMSGSEIASTFGIAKGYANKLLRWHPESVDEKTGSRNGLHPAIYKACMFTRTPVAPQSWLFDLVRDHGGDLDAQAKAWADRTGVTIDGVSVKSGKPVAAGPLGSNGASKGEKVVADVPRLITSKGCERLIHEYGTLLAKGNALNVKISDADKVAIKIVIATLRYVVDTRKVAEAPFSAKLTALATILAAKADQEKADAAKAAKEAAEAD